MLTIVMLRLKNKAQCLRKFKGNAVIAKANKIEQIKPTL
jgi:hypothetical protein